MGSRYYEETQMFFHLKWILIYKMMSVHHPVDQLLKKKNKGYVLWIIPPCFLLINKIKQSILEVIPGFLRVYQEIE